MIGSLRGVIADREPAADRNALGEVLIEVAGVGYRVVVTGGTLGHLHLGSDAMLHTHHHIREADQKLYGFLAKEERVAFEGLLAAHGVGPALAMAVLATHPAARLSRILADDDLAALCEVPGVGKKTAQRMLVELKSTLVLTETPSANGGIDPADPLGGDPASAIDDVREALVNLGYSGSEIRVALASLPADSGTADPGQLLKVALRTLAGVR